MSLGLFIDADCLLMSSELKVLHLSQDSDTLLCGYTQPTVGLARPVLCIKLTPCGVESGVTATNACTPDRSGHKTRHLPKRCATIASRLS